MASVTFDQLDLIDKLKQAGISVEQSEAIVRSIAKAQDGLVTKEYLDNKLNAELAPIKSDLRLIKWMLAIVIAVSVVPALTKLLSL